jgi:hypothetical protein
MADIYDEFQQIARDVMPEFEQGVITLINITPGGGPADEPGAPTETTVPLPGAVAKGVSFKYVNNTTILATDKMVTAPVVAGVTPGTSGFVTIDGVRHKIIADVSTPGAGTQIVWKFIVRKGG